MISVEDLKEDKKGVDIERERERERVDLFAQKLDSSIEQTSHESPELCFYLIRSSQQGKADSLSIYPKSYQNIPTVYSKNK